MPDFSQESANKADMMKDRTLLWRYKQIGRTRSCSWSLDTRGSKDRQKKKGVGAEGGIQGK